MATLIETLGHKTQNRLLVLTADQLGMCHAANLGVYQSLSTGLATGASLMVPAPWSRQAARHYQGEPIGVQLTLNAELDSYRWRPITFAPSLLDGDGGFPRTVNDLWDHADLDETRSECRAQLERAILWGFDICHLSTHLGALQNRPEFFDVLLDLAIEYRLPIRLESGDAEKRAGFPFRELAAESGVLTVDHYRLRPLADLQTLETQAIDLLPGVTEIVFEPAIDTPELRAICENWDRRVEHHDLLSNQSKLYNHLRQGKITLTNWREIREAQRSLT